MLAAVMALALPVCPTFAQGTAAPRQFEVVEQPFDDLKSVFATVQSKDLTNARVRTPGTVVSLKVDEGTPVTAGQILAVVTDPKIALRIKALDAQIEGLESRLATAKLEFERTRDLRQRGVAPQSRLDQLKTELDVAENNLKAARSDRLVAEQQADEGQVLAPAEGRVLKVAVTVGSVVLPGESVATIAANEFLLRLSLPERHARFVTLGDTVRIGARGHGAGKVAGEGKVIQVYPELQSGRVIVDVEASGLGDYFVGERTLVWISAGRRRAIAVPDDFLFRRFGHDYVRLKRDDATTVDVVVQLGQQRTLADGKAAHEVLAGLRPGDVITSAATPGATKQ